MKASILSLLATLAAFQTAAALPAEASAKLTPIPEGLPDGIYAGNLNDDGTTSWEFIEAVKVTAPPAVEKRQGGYGVLCDTSRWVNSDERWSALNGLADYCGNGRFFNSRTISVRKSMPLSLSDHLERIKVD